MAHRNRWFTYKKWWFSMAMLINQWENIMFWFKKSTSEVISEIHFCTFSGICCQDVVVSGECRRKSRIVAPVQVAGGTPDFILHKWDLMYVDEPVATRFCPYFAKLILNCYTDTCACGLELWVGDFAACIRVALPHRSGQRSWNACSSSCLACLS